MNEKHHSICITSREKKCNNNNNQQQQRHFCKIPNDKNVITLYEIMLCEQAIYDVEYELLNDTI